jgi:hypothetical protein
LPKACLGVDRLQLELGDLHPTGDALGDGHNRFFDTFCRDGEGPDG